MTTKIFTLNERGALVPQDSIPATPLAIGQIVTYEDRANPRREFVILGPVPPSDWTPAGTMRALCLEDGHESQVREFENTGHAGWQMGDRILSTDELLDAFKAAGENKTRLQAEAEAAAQARAAQRAAQRAKWAVEFAYLQTGDPSKSCWSHVLGAKNIRAELKRAFPGVKFSVTSKGYTGGNSIDIHWQLGPTVEAVEKITGKYQEGHFDGMEDIYKSSGALWPEIYGGAKYVMESRSFPAELHEQIGRALCALQRVEFNGQWTRGLLGQDDDRDLQQHVNALLSKTDWPVGAGFAGVDFKEKSSEDCDTFKRLYEKYGQGFYNEDSRAKMTPEDQAALAGYAARRDLQWCRVLFKTEAA